MVLESSSRELWQFITGKTLIRPPEFVSKEIKNNRDRLIAGLRHYKPFKKLSTDEIKKACNRNGQQLEFVQKLAAFLNLDEIQTHKLFCKYLVTDYRGPQKELQAVLASDRHSQALILRINDYYYRERLFLLHCIQHILSHWQDQTHPYQEQYAQFLEDATSGSSLIDKVISQYETVCESPSPTWEKHGNLMNEKQAAQWMIQNLKEQCELLQIILLFYKDFEHSADSMVNLASKFKKQGFGRRQHNKHLLDESADSLVHTIGHLQVLLIIEGFDLEYLYKLSIENKTQEHHIVGSNKFEDLDVLMSSLGDSAHHSPLLLMWAVVHQLVESHKSSHVVRKLGYKAQQWKVFHYLHALIQAHPFCRKDLHISLVTNHIIYGLLHPILSVFDEETLGDTEILYTLASKLVAQPDIVDDVLAKGEQQGLGTLLQTSLSRFPLDFHPLLQIITGISSAGPTYSRKAISLIQALPLYTEYFDESRPADLRAVDSSSTQWQLIQEKLPYGADCFVIPAGTCGETSPTEGKANMLIQWQFSYNGWQIFWCEIAKLLDQIAHGAGSVHRESLQRVIDVLQLLKVVMNNEPTIINQFTELTDLVYMVIQRFCLVQPAPLDLLAVSVEVVTCVAKRHPTQAWHKLQQTGFLPFLTETFDNFSEYASGAGLNSGAYGSVLAGGECMTGEYSVTLALLELCTALVQPLQKHSRSQELFAVQLFVSREIFPAFHKWRYKQLSTREQIGKKCLEFYHAVLNTINAKEEKEKPSTTQHIAGSVSISLQDLCVYSMLHSDAGRALLDIISTGTDTIETVLAGNISDIAGLELIQLLRLALSVLNRLLLIKATIPSLQTTALSPVEQCLSHQPISHTGQHIVAVIAHYIYHRHDTRLPTLATLLLRRIAQEYPMSMLACLGSTAEAVREMYLFRLQAHTEDPRLKVVILELMSACVDCQPGLIEMFLNVDYKTHNRLAQNKQLQSTGKPEETAKPSTSTSSSGSTSTSATQSSSSSTTGQSISSSNSSGNSLLHILDKLINGERQGSVHCPAALLCAAMEFVHALWHHKSDTAMAVLKNKDDFWLNICLSLTRDLPKPASPVADADDNTSDDKDHQHVAMKHSEVRSCAHIIHVLALELYYNYRGTLDKSFVSVFSKIISEGRIVYWSEYLYSCIEYIQQCDGMMSYSDETYEVVSYLLRAWRALMVVLSVSGPKVKDVCLTDNMKDCILKDLLAAIEKQLSGEQTEPSLRLTSVYSALYFNLIAAWRSSVQDWSSTMRQLLTVLNQACVSSQVILSSINIGIASSITVALQHNKDLDDKISISTIHDTISAVCELIQQSTLQLGLPPKPYTNHTNRVDTGEGEHTSGERSEKDTELKLKLQTLSVQLLCELLSWPGVASDVWLRAIRAHSLLQTLLPSVHAWMEVQQGLSYVLAAYGAMLKMATDHQGAECLAISGLTRHLCLSVSNLYTYTNPQSNTAADNSCGATGSASGGATGAIGAVGGGATGATTAKSSAVTSTSTSSGAAGGAGAGVGVEPATWLTVYHSHISLYSLMFIQLKHGFLEEALNFLGVHQDRIIHCLDSVHHQLQLNSLCEVEQACAFLQHLSHYKRQWRLHLPVVMANTTYKLRASTQECVFLLIRPTLLQHMINNQSGLLSDKQVLLKSISTSITRQLSTTQACIEDLENTSVHVLAVQEKLLQILAHSLTAMINFLPNLCEIVLDQSLDIEEYESLLGIGFATPSIDSDTGPTFGTPLTCANMCLRLLSKIDNRGASPVRGGEHTDLQIRKSLVVYVYENSLYLVMVEAARYLRDPKLPLREKQLLKRELGTELNSILQAWSRQLRRGGVPTSPAIGAVSPTKGAKLTPKPSKTPLKTTSTSALANVSASELAYYKLVDNYVKNVLR